MRTRLLACVAGAWTLVMSVSPVSGAAPDSAQTTQPPAANRSSSRDESEAPLLAVLAPVETGEGILIPGSTAEVFAWLVEEVRPEHVAVGERQWLSERGVAFQPRQRDAVVAPDYSPKSDTAGLVYRWDRLTSASTMTYRLPIKEGKAFLRGLPPGEYCLFLPGEKPLACTTTVAGPVTLVRSEAWEPMSYVYWISTLRTLNAEAFRAALSPAPFAQINPLIQRLRSTQVLTPVELFVFYRGYYEALALARWLETSPEGNLPFFLDKVQVTDAEMDPVVAEALQAEQVEHDLLLRDLSVLGTDARTPTPSPTPIPTTAAEASPTPAPPPPTLTHYRAIYHLGQATLFLAEASDKSILTSQGRYVHAEEAGMYESQYRELAGICLQRVRAVEPANPLLATLDVYLRQESRP